MTTRCAALTAQLEVAQAAAGGAQRAAAEAAAREQQVCVRGGWRGR